MSAPTLAKGETAILVIDWQNDFVHEQGKVGGSPIGGAMLRIIKEKNILGNIKKLMVAGRAAQVPIIHVRHAYRPDYADLPSNVKIFQGMKQMQAVQDGTWGAEIHADLKAEASDFVVTKTRVSAFYASPLEGILQAQGITHLVLTGVATDGAVEGTARDGADRGYAIIIPDDCCAGSTEEAHRVVLGGILSLLTTVCKAEEVVAALS
jgi:nicotinamidase-related amidase